MAAVSALCRACLFLLWTQTCVARASQSGLDASGLSRNGSDAVPQCASSCLEANPKDEKCAWSCRRGCRFFSLVHLASSSPSVGASTTVSATSATTDATSSKELCLASCMEAYSDTKERYACHVGCAFAAGATPALTNQLEDAKWWWAPLEGVRSVVGVSWTLVVGGGDEEQDVARSSGADTVVFLRANPSSMVGNEENDDEDDEEEEEEAEDPVEELMQDPGVRVQLAGAKKVQTMPRRHGYVRHQQFQDDGPDEELEEEGSNVVDLDQEMVVVGSKSAYYQQHLLPSFSSGYPGDWLSCVSRKSGFPRWALASALFAAIVAVVWLCLAATSAPTAIPMHMSPATQEYLPLYQSDAILTEKTNHSQKPEEEHKELLLLLEDQPFVPNDVDKV